MFVVRAGGHFLQTSHKQHCATCSLNYLLPPPSRIFVFLCHILFFASVVRKKKFLKVSHKHECATCSTTIPAAINHLCFLSSYLVSKAYQTGRACFFFFISYSFFLASVVRKKKLFFEYERNISVLYVRSATIPTAINHLCPLFPHNRV